MISFPPLKKTLATATTGQSGGNAVSHNPDTCPVPKEYCPSSEERAHEKQPNGHDPQQDDLAGRAAQCKTDIETLSQRALRKKYRPEYSSWSNAKNRAKKIYHVPFAAEFKTFLEFLAQLGPKPYPADSLDRIDSAAGYVLGNVRWASKQMQSENRKNVKTYDVNGIQMTLPRLAKHIGKGYDTVRKRLRRGTTIQELIEGTASGNRSAVRRRRTLAEWPWPDGEKGEKWEKLYLENNRGQEHRVLFFIQQLEIWLEKYREEVDPEGPLPDDLREKLDRHTKILAFAHKQRERVIEEERNARIAESRHPLHDFPSRHMHEEQDDESEDDDPNNFTEEDFRED